MLRGPLQDGAVPALVPDLVGQAGHDWLAIGSQGDLGQAAAVDGVRDELRGEGRGLRIRQTHRGNCAWVLVDNYELGGELLARVGLDKAIVREEQVMVQRHCGIG